MASDNEASCVCDPNFAVICSFLECFGKSCGINYPDIAKLQEMIEDAHEVPQPLVELHIKLLRKARKSVSPEKWERSLVKFCHTYSNQDGWELERFGYKKARIAVKLRLLKVLLEAQFDLNPRFKNEVNKLAAEQLRVEPMGRDKTGLAYWFQLDEECNMRVYREDLDEENWELVARDREGVVSLINALSDGEAGPIPIDEDSNSLEISEKPIIDTGQAEESSSPEEASRVENNIPKETKPDVVPPMVVNNKLPITAVEDEESADNEEDEEGDEEEEEEEVSNGGSSEQNSEDDDEEEEEEDEEEDDEDDSQDASESQDDTSQTVTSSRIVEKHVPQIVQAKQPIVAKQSREPLKVTTPEVSCVPVAVNPAPLVKPAISRQTVVETTPPKAIETPVIRTSPLKLVNIQDLQHPVEERIPQREEKYPSKPPLVFQPSDSGMALGKFPSKPIDKLAANLSRIQSEKLEKPGAAKLLEKIAENLARSSGAHASLANGDDDKLHQDFIARSISEKSNSSNIVPSRSQRGMDLSTSPRGCENPNDHSRPMDYSGIDLSSRKSTKPTDLHQSGYRSQEFQHREMDLSTRKMPKPDINPMAYDPRSVILRNHTMVTDLSKKQMAYSGYDIPSAAAYHNATARLPGKDEHRLPNYTILSDPSKISSMRMAGGPLKRPLEMIDDPQQEMMKRMRADTIAMRNAIDTRPLSVVGGLRREEVGPAIEEPVMMVRGEGSGSDCDAVNPIVGEAIEEEMLFFHGEGAGHECDTGNPGDDTSSDQKESNKSKNEDCSDVSTSLTPTKVTSGDAGVNDTTSTDGIPTISSSLNVNDNYSQESSHAGGTTDNCQSTVVSSVSPKSKFKPTLGVQVIAKSSTSPSKKSSRWDVRRPEGKSEECDSSIISSEGNISPADEGINVDEYHNTETSRTIAEGDHVVAGKFGNDDITSTSNQTISPNKTAECTSSVGGSDDFEGKKETSSTIPDSSIAISEKLQCNSSDVATSSAAHSQSMESTVRQERTGDEASIEEKSRNDETGESNGSPPRFFFGPNCVSYTSKNDLLGHQVAATSVTTCESTILESIDVAKNNNNFLKIADTYNSESSESSCDGNIETRLKKVELKEEKKPDIVIPGKSEEAGQSECKVQSSTGFDAKNKTDSVAISEPMDAEARLEAEKDNVTRNIAVSVDTTDRLEPAEATPVSKSHSSQKMDYREAESSAEASISQSSLAVPESTKVTPIEEESEKICDVKTSTSVSIDEVAMEVDEEEKERAVEGKILPEAELSADITEADEEKEETRQTSENPLSTPNEAASSSLQETPDDSCQTNDTVEEKLEESKQLELSSDIDDKTKQSTESEDDSMSVVKNNEEKTNELCNEDAQDGFSKSSETVDETKDISGSTSNIPKVQQVGGLSLDEKSLTSVELPEDSSGDSAAASSSSLLVNPSGGEDSVTSDREICESLSLHDNSEASPIDEKSPTDEVSPAVIVDSNISRSPERITVASQKASSSTRLLDALDTYTDELSENPSSGDQDSNEAMVIDDRTSDSNESTNFKDKLPKAETPAERTAAELEGPKFIEPDREPKLVSDQAVEKSDEIEHTGDRDDPPTVSVDLNTGEDTEGNDDPNPAKIREEIESKGASVSSKVDEPVAATAPEVQEKSMSIVDVEEKSAPNLQAEEKIVTHKESQEKSAKTVEFLGKSSTDVEGQDRCVTSVENQEKCASGVQSSLVPNYDCSDDDNVSDDVFESDSIDTKDVQEEVEVEKSILQNEIKITDEDRLAEVSEGKNLDESVEAKASSEKVAHLRDESNEEESKSQQCENNKDFSDGDFENDENEDSGEKLQIDLEAPSNQILDIPRKVEDPGRQVKPSEKIESDESPGTIDKTTDDVNKIPKKSRDLSVEDVSTSVAQDLEVQQKPDEIQKIPVMANDIAASTELRETISGESEEIEQAVSVKTTWEEPFTEENSKSNQIAAEAALEAEHPESLSTVGAASSYNDDKDIKTNESKSIVEPDALTMSEASKSEISVDDSLPVDSEAKPDALRKIHETVLLPEEEQNTPDSSKVCKEISESLSVSNDRRETKPLSVEEHHVPKNTKVSEDKFDVASRSIKQDEITPLHLHQTEVPESSGVDEESTKSESPGNICDQEATNPLVQEEDKIHESSKLHTALGVVAHSISSEKPRQTIMNNALPKEVVSGPSDEEISNAGTLKPEPNATETKVDASCEKPEEIPTSLDPSKPTDHGEIIDAASLKNELKKEASKRLHGASDGDDFPPTKSKPPNVDFAKETPDYRPNDEKTDDKSVVSRPEIPTQVAFATQATPGNTIAPPTELSQPVVDSFDKLKNLDADKPRENVANPSIEGPVSVDKKSSDIQSVDLKCIDIESDDSMGIDNESIFNTTADDVDPLACTEADLSKPSGLEIASEPKIGIRLKPVEDLVYEGWKLDSSEQAAPPTVSRKRRNSAHESNTDDGTAKLDDADDGETGGKRMKLRGKRSPDMKLRKSVEQCRPEPMSSEDEASKAQTAEDTVELKASEENLTALEKARNDRKPRGRPRGKRRRGNRSIARATRVAKTMDVTPASTELGASVDADNITENATLSEHVVASAQTGVNVGQVESKKKRKKRKMVLGLEVGIDIVVPDSQTGQDEVPVRQSRRIAQLKIKEEADKRRIEEETLDDMKVKKDRDGTEKKKRKKQKPESEDEPVVAVKEVEREVKTKKHRKKKKFSAKEFNEANPWQSSSGSSTSDEEAQEDEDDEDVESEGSLLFKSDHEFSPESDLEKDEESEPLRRARTAQKSTSDVEEAVDEYACQKCGKADHPEWILLCDTCDKGWHCSCLRPALMLIPEGDWFCPPCQHNVLVTKLRESLKTFDLNSKKHENEVLRKKRLAFVGISLDNVIHKTEAGRGDRSSSHESDNESSSSSSESSSSSSSSEESEPVYQLRERRCANTYKFNEYDDMINAAIGDEVEAVQGAGNQGRGKDIATIVNAEKEEAQAEALKGQQLEEDDDETKKSEKESDEDYKLEKDDFEDDEEDTGRKIIIKKTLSRKKHRKLNSLDISSEDDPESDEDFKGSSSDEEEDYDDQMYSTDDSFAQSRRRGRKGDARPVRRSTRAARKTRYDEDFINDDSDDSDRPKRKKSKSVWEGSGSESEESDNSWRQKKKKSRTVPAPRVRASSKTKSRKKKKRRRIIEPDNQSDNDEAIEAQHEDVDEKEEAVATEATETTVTTERTDVQPQEAQPSIENVVVAPIENIVSGENHEGVQVVDKDETIETPNLDEELPTKKKKESTPKQKKTPGIRRKIVYGGLGEDGPRQEEETLSRRTRGRKINYQFIMGSDSEEELKKVLRKTEESEDEFVVNEGEEFNEDAEKDSDSGDVYSPNKDVLKGKAKSPKAKKPKKSKSPGGRKSLTDNGTPKERKKPGPKPGSKNRPRQSSLSIAPDIKPKDTDSITRGLDIEGSTMSATGSVIGEVPEGSLTGLTPEDINALDDEQIEQMMMEDEEYGRRQLELAAIEIARNKKQEEREAKKLEKARLKALEILAAEQQRDPNAPEGMDGEVPKKKKRGRRSKAEILAEQMRRDGVPSLLTGSMIPAVVQDVTTNIATNVMTNPTLPTVVSAIETSRSPDAHIPLMAGPDGQLYNPDGSSMKPKRRGRGKGKKTLALEAARAAEAAAKGAPEIGPFGIAGTDSNPEVKHDDIPNVLPTPGSSTSGSAPPTPPASSVVGSQGHQPAQSPSQQQTVYPSLPPSQQSSVITRMLQSQPVSSAPQSFTAAAAAMGHKYFGGPNPAGQMMAGPRPSNYDMPPRGRIPSPYRQPGPSPMPPHFAAIRSVAPPMRMRGPGPQLYHTPHHPMDPSPSGGGPISINSRDRSSPLGPGPSPAMIPPAAGSPLAKGGPTPPPPPYVRGGPALARFTDNPQMGPRHQVPPFTTPSPTNHSLQQPSPPPNRPPGNFSPYHPPPPPNYHYGAYPPPPPMTTADDAAAYQGSPYSAEHFSTPAETQPPIQQPPQPPPPPGPPQPHANEPPGPGNKQYDEEGTGEFGGLVSYFSSQREDDLDS